MKHTDLALNPSPIRAKPYARTAVLGAGAWGTALAATLARAGGRVTLWSRDAEQARAINETHRNDRYLKDIPLPETLRAEPDMKAALEGAEAVLVVVPSQVVREVSREAARHAAAGVPFAVCAKGIEAETGLLMAQVVRDELGDRPVGVVSGPTFAHETALNHPTAATCAFPFTYAERLDPASSSAARLAVSLTTEASRTYVTDDLVGVEVGGAVKNVIAIACGMMTGAGFGENTRAALITRGIAETKTLAEALGGRAETLSGLSGVGDLSLTCSSESSRNMSLGLQLGRGLAREDCFDGRPVVVEGERNARSVTDLARRLGVTLPICETVRAVLHDRAHLGQSFAALWARPLEAEPRVMDLAFDHPASDTAVTQLAERIS
jgi:glycerol-3-phosphate dehydrogenase (NAD(P)+)